MAKYFFLHVGIVALLYTIITTFITFSFEIINYLFPDRQAYSFDLYGSSLRWSVSIIIVAFPVLIYLYKLVYKELTLHPEDRGMALRKWISYLTIFLSSVAIIVDVIVLLNTFLNGEISGRFFSKFAIVLAVAFATFWYTVRDTKGVYFEKPQLLKIFTTVVSVVLFASIVGGFFIMGSPATQRKLRDDQDRIGDLSSVQWNVLNYYQRTGALPKSIDNLKNDFDMTNYNEAYTDPVTEIPYEYREMTGTTSIAFELCATFDLASKDLEGKGAYPSGYSYDYAVSRPIEYGNFDQNFRHSAGRNCFTRTIDPKLYPPYDNAPKPL